MRTLIVYYSLEGNTAHAAEQIAAALPADTLRLEPVKAYPDKGFRKFFWGGKSAVMGEMPALQPYRFNDAAYDRVILGFPVWAGNMAPPIRTFIRDHSLAEKRVAAFACQSGAGAEKAFGKLKTALGIPSLEAEAILIDPLTKPSPENERTIRQFCKKLAEQDG